MKNWDEFINQATNKYGGSDIDEPEFESFASGANSGAIRSAKRSNIPQFGHMSSGGSSSVSLGDVGRANFGF